MGAGEWLGLVLGSGLGVLYILASFLMLVLGARNSARTRRFYRIVLGGMLVRMAVALLLFMLGALLLPVGVPAFTLAFFFVFVVGLAGEVAWLHRNSDRFSVDDERR